MPFESLSWGTPTRIALGRLVFDVSMTGPEAGDPVVLLHGFPQSRAAWAEVAPRLAAAGLRVIAPDQRGYSPGARPVGPANYHIDALVGDVLGLLDAIGLPAVHLVGHDWGATVAWFVAARHPDRVRSLTAVSVPHPAAFGRALAGDADQREGSAYIRLFRTEKAERVLLADDARRLRRWFPAAVPRALVDLYLGELRHPGALTARLNWYRAMTRDFQALGPVVVPTTYVWGAGDVALRRTAALLCAEQVTGEYRFAELSSTGHWIPEVAPDALVSHILARIASPSYRVEWFDVSNRETTVEPERTAEFSAPFPPGPAVVHLHRTPEE
ncbi:alpha/beta fold hydrolase [Dactylosporangium sp. CA-092794]|uniref:alpha/beta fold hydrolase n=1 Tax=Dactylosporangium sp. CA-092794 TaxID=3239929 RepID=UPI003D8E73F5